MKDITVLAGLLCLGVMTLLSVPRAFFVMDDEGTLLNTALSIYEEAEVFAAHQGYWVDGSFEIIDGRLDKRPYLYAYLISGVHHLVGYSVENGFLLNFVLGLLAIVVGWLLLRPKYSRKACFFGLLCLLVSPVFIQAARSSGFDLLNFVLLGLLGWAYKIYAERSDSLSESFLLCICVLLAYCRYEAVLAVCVVGVYILLKRAQTHSESVGLASRSFWCVCMWALVPMVWLIRCTFARVDGFQTLDKPEVPVFSYHYLGQNLWDACVFIFGFQWVGVGSQVLIYVSMAGLFIGCVQFAKSTPSRRFLDPIVWWLLTAALTMIVIFSYYWSSFLDPLAQRMSLPLLWLFVLGGAHAVDTCWRWGKILKVGVVVLYLVVGSYGLIQLPSIIQINRVENSLARLQTWKMDWLEGAGLDPRDTLFIDPHPQVWTAMRYSAITPMKLSSRLAQLELHQRIGTFRNVIFVELEVRDERGKMFKRTLLYNRFQFESNRIASLEINPQEKMIFRKVSSVKLDHAPITLPESGSGLWQLP